MRILVLVFLGIALCTAVARDVREQQRIEFLIETIASLKGAVFLRNGTEHDAHAAAERRARLLDRNR